MKTAWKKSQVIYFAIKRLLDIVFSLIGLILLIPVFIIIGPIIKLHDGGPVFFKQKRSGKHGKPFMLVKFRSMAVGNDVYNFKEEDRITPIGKFIRKTSIDELPQFWNILKGDMSFIGPRPWVEAYYTNMNAHERKRFVVRPGITGLAQVMGRNNLDIHEKIKYDLEYIKKVSLLEDIKIFFLTIKVVATGAGTQHSKRSVGDEINMLKDENAAANPKAKSKSKAKYSVLMSVYAKEKPAFLKESIESMLNQSLPTDDFVIVEDGPLTNELYALLESYKKDKRFTFVKLAKNSGLGVSLDNGLKKCKNELVLRMDSDDISVPERAELQVRFLQENPSVYAAGGQIYEFRDNPSEKRTRLKVMPTKSAVSKYITKRNPLNHMTVAFRKTPIIKAGGYVPLPYMEDYWLWVRVFAGGGAIDNLDCPLAYARTGDDFTRRRGNKAQLKSWRTIQRFMLEKGMISKHRARKNVFNMWLMVNLPNSIRKMAYGIMRGRHG